MNGWAEAPVGAVDAMIDGAESVVFVVVVVCPAYCLVDILVCIDF